MSTAPASFASAGASLPTGESLSQYTNPGHQGAGTRVRATDQYPWSAVGQLIAGGLCSGAVIDDNHVLTAAHCVYNKSSDEWRPGPWFFSPGLNETEYPFSTRKVTYVQTFTEYVESHNRTYDIAVLTLAEPVGAKTGTFGYEFNPSSDPVYSTRTHLTGYPGSTGKFATAVGQQVDLRVNGEGTSGIPLVSDAEDCKQNDLCHNIDTGGALTEINRGGFSGGPVWIGRSGELPSIVSVNSAGPNFPLAVQSSIAVRITAEKSSVIGRLVQRGEEIPLGPNPKLTAERTTVTAGEKLGLRVSRSGRSPYEIDTYRWDFDGDGTTDRTTSKPTTTYSFEQSGTVTVTVTVIDTHGRNATATTRVTVEPAPTVSRTSPGDGGTVGADATLSWSGPSGATYDVYLAAGDSTPDESDIVANDVSKTSLSQSLESGTTYYWKVVATTSNGQRVESSVGTFTTEQKETSGSFSAKRPADGQGDIGLGTTLQWSGPERSRFTEYAVYIDTDKNPLDGGELIRSTRGTEVDVDDLKPGTTYYWQVVATDDGFRAESPVWSFSTAPRSGSLSISDVRVEDEITIDGASQGDETTMARLTFYATAEETSSESGGGFDVYVLNKETGVVLGTMDGDTDAEGNRFDVELELSSEEALFKTPGKHTLVLVGYHHATGETVRKEVTVEVTVEGEAGEVIALPERPTTSDTITLDARNVKTDTYDWTVFYENDETGEEVFILGGQKGSEVSFDARDATSESFEEVEYSIANSNGRVVADGGVGVLDDGDFYEPDMSVGQLKLPSSAVQGTPVSASIRLTNDGGFIANYIVRWKVDGRIVEVDTESIPHLELGENGAADATENTKLTLRPGKHEITAVVITAQGKKRTRSKEITVEKRQPPSVSNPSPSSSSTGVPTDTTLSWSASDPDGDSLTYTVYLEAGDRTPDEKVGSGLSQSSVTPDLKPGTTYYWQVVVTDSDDATKRGPVWSFTTAQREPTAAFTTTPQEPRAGQSITFDATGSEDPDGSIESYAWDFDGDGQTDATGRTVDHAFTEPGTYEVTLNVTDDNGATATERQTITVTGDTRPPTVSSFDATADGSTVRITVTTDERLRKLTVELGEQTLERSAFQLTDTDPFRYVAVVSAEPGTTVTARLVNATDEAGNDGASGQSATATVPEPNTRPTARFSANTTETSVGTPVGFDATTSSDPDGSVRSYAWDFDGDGQPDATGATPTHTFTEPGTYTVTLAVTDDDGATNTTTTTVTVSAGNTPPDATVSANATTVSAGTAIRFDATGSTDADGDSLRYAWDIDGDGRFDDVTGRATVVRSLPVGTHTVTVRISDGKTASTATVTVTVTDTETPSAEISGTRKLPSAVQPGETVTVTVTVTVSGSVAGLAVNESVPLPVQSQTTTPPATFKPSEVQWLWLGVENRTVTVEYTVKIPEDATPGTQYELTGRVSSSDLPPRAVTGETTITVRRCPASAVAGGDDRIDLREIQRAIGAWADDETVAGQRLDLRKIQRLIGIWADDEPARCEG
ncbi:MAG: PKD domain-containing protein [Halobaculum sp.]